MKSPSRRNLLKAVALTPAVALIPVAVVRDSGVAQASAPGYAQPSEAYLTPAELAFGPSADLDEVLAGDRFDIRRVDHCELSALESLARDEVQDVEGIV